MLDVKCKAIPVAGRGDVEAMIPPSENPFMKYGIVAEYSFNLSISISQQKDKIYRSVIKLNSIGLSVPRRKHITSQLRAQQVNAI
jgi:hypothetical protein